MQIERNNMTRKYTFITLIFLSSVTCGYSQKVNCATAVKDAEEMYKNGNYDNVIESLATTIKDCSLSKREKEDAYILLAQSHLEKGNFKDANRYLIKILNNDPNYKVKDNVYQEDFYAYYNRINIRPMLYAGLKLGLNIPLYSTKKVYSVYDSADYSSDYKPIAGFHYGAFVEWQFYKNVSIAVEGGLAQSGYERTIKGSGIDKFSLKYSEQLNSSEGSVYLKKYFLKKQYKPYIYLGGYITKLTKATGNIEVSYTSKDRITSDLDEYNLSKSNVDVLEMRNVNRKGIIAGLGFSHKAKNFLLSADVGYRMDIGKHLINTEKRYNDKELLFKYYYVDNDVNLSRLDISLSVAYIFKYSIKSK